MCLELANNTVKDVLELANSTVKDVFGPSLLYNKSFLKL